MNLFQKSLWAGPAFLAAVIGVAAVPYHLHLKANTLFSDERVRHLFPNIVKGDSLESVLARLGAPLYVSYLKEGVHYTAWNPYAVEDLKNHDCSLMYSKPAVPGDFLHRDIHVRDGVVVDKIVGWSD